MHGQILGAAGRPERFLRYNTTRVTEAFRHPTALGRTAEP